MTLATYEPNREDVTEFGHDTTRMKRPGVYRTVGLPGGEGVILHMEWHRQLIDTTPRTPGYPSVPTQSWRELGIMNGHDYGWARIVRESTGVEERWLIEYSAWSRKLDADEPDPVIEERPVIEP